MRANGRFPLVVGATLAWAVFAPLRAGAQDGAAPFTVALTSEDARRIMEARWAIDRLTRQARDLKEFEQEAAKYVTSQIAQGHAYRGEVDRLLATMRQKRVPGAEIELIQRGLEHVSGYVFKLEQYRDALHSQVEGVHTTIQQYESMLSLYERLKRTPQDVAVLPLDGLPQLERSVGVTQAGATAKQKALEAAASDVGQARTQTEDAQRALHIAEQALAEFEAKAAAQKQRSADWKGRVLDVMKLPVKVVKAPLDMLDRLGDDTGAIGALSHHNQLLLHRCKISLLAATKLLADRQAEAASQREELAKLEHINAELEMRIAAETVAGLRERAKKAALAQKQADADEAGRQAGIKKASAAAAEVKLDRERDRVEKTRIALARQLQETEDNDQRTLLELDLAIATETIADIELQIELVLAEALLKGDEAKLAELGSLLALIQESRKSTAELAADQEFVARERSNLSHDRATLASLESDAAGTIAHVSTKLTEARSDELPVAGMPSRVDIDSLLLSSQEAREAHRAKLDGRRALLQHQLTRATRIKEVWQTRLRTADKRSEMLKETEHKLSARRAAALWDSTQVVISLAAAKTAWQDTVSLYGRVKEQLKKAPEFAKNWRTDRRLPGVKAHLLHLLGGLLLLFVLRRFCLRGLRSWRHRCKGETQGRLRDRLRQAIPYALSRSLTVLLLCAAIAASALWLVPNQVVSDCLLAMAWQWAGFRLLHALSGACFSVRRGNRRIVLCNPGLCRHLHRVLGMALFVGFVTLLLRTVLHRVGYNPDVIAFGVTACWMLLIVLAITFFSHPFFIQLVMPQATTWLGRTVRFTLTVLYPPVGLFVLAVLGTWLAGYRVMAKTMALTLLWSAAVVVAAFMVFRWVVHHVNRCYRLPAAGDDAEIPERAAGAGEGDEEDGEAEPKVAHTVVDEELEEGAARGVARSVGASPEDEELFAAAQPISVAASLGHALTFLLVIGVAYFVIHLWHERFRDALWSPAAPVTVQMAVTKAAEWKAQVLQFVCEHKLELGAKKPTTPWQICIGLMVGAAGFFFASLVRRIMDRITVSAPARRMGAWHTLRSCVYYAVLAIMGAIGLTVAGIPLSVLTVFAGAFGIGIGFGMQNIISNFISGIIILFEQPIKPRDFIDVDEKWSGWVRRVGTRSTTIRTRDNVNVVVPNSKFIESTVVNWHGVNPQTRIHVPIGVAYGSDVPKVRMCLAEVAYRNEEVLDNPYPEVWFLGFGDSSLDFDLLCWVKDPNRIPYITSEINYAIDDMLRKHDITIPFPQRDLHVKSSVALPHREVPGDDATEGAPGAEAADDA